MTTLTTKRLLLRKPKTSDATDIQEACNNKKLSRYLATVTYPYKKKDAETFITSAKKKWRNKKEEIYFIEHKKDKKVIGVLGLTIKEKDNKASTGSWINPHYWKKGYITEAKIAVNEHAFNKHKVRKLETEVATNNKASKATQKGIGYEYEGTRKQSVISQSTGKIHDLELYGLLKKDWKKKLPKIKKKLEEKIRRLEKR